MSAYAMADPPNEATVNWALQVAQAAEVVKQTDEAAAAARLNLGMLLTQRPQDT